MGLPQGADGTLPCPHLVDTVHDLGSGAGSVAALPQEEVAFGAYHAQAGSPWLGCTVAALAIAHSHSPYCPGGGGCSCEGKEPLVGGSQGHWTQLQ